MPGPPVYFEDSGVAFHCGKAQTEGSGDASMDALCDWSRCSHVTILWRKTNLYVSRMNLLALTTWRYFNMDSKLRVFDLVVPASSCYAVKFCISPGYNCLHT